MFISKYVDDFYLTLIYDKYDISYLESLDYENFNKIFELFKKYNFYYIEDIIVRYLELFSMDHDEVFDGIKMLNDKLGDDFIKIIGDNMTYLEEILY